MGRGRKSRKQFRTPLLHTGESSSVPGGLFRRRVAACPQAAPFPGAARRSAPVMTGQQAAPSLPRQRRQGSSPFAAWWVSGQARRGRFSPAGAATAVPAVRFRLRAQRATGVRLSADRETTFTRKASGTMSIASYLSFFRGEDVVLDFEMTPLVDITGWAISLKVADTLGGSVQFTKSATVTDGPRGKFRVTISSADTAGLTAGRYTWDARRTDSGAKATLAHGEIDLKREVTA